MGTLGTPRGLDIHRFGTTADGWFGNFEFHLKSIFTDDQLVNAWVSGNREDSFILPPDENRLASDGLSSWARVFGPAAPVPEPSTIFLLSLGLAGLACAQIRRA